MPIASYCGSTMPLLCWPKQGVWWLKYTHFVVICSLCTTGLGCFSQFNLRILKTVTNPPLSKKVKLSCITTASVTEQLGKSTRDLKGSGSGWTLAAISSGTANAAAASVFLASFRSKVQSWIRKCICKLWQMFIMKSTSNNLLFTCIFSSVPKSVPGAKKIWSMHPYFDVCSYFGDWSAVITDKTD